MKRSTRWAAVILLTVAPLAGLTYADPQWPEEAGLDLWHAPALRAELDQCHQRRAELDAELRTVRVRLERKAEILADVIAGRETLQEAAREFRALNAANPDFVRVMRFRYPDCSEDELHVHNLVDMVRHSLEQRPERTWVLARVDAEYEQLKRGGPVSLD